MNRVAWVGVDPGGQPVDDHIPGRLFDPLRIIVLRRQRVPVGDEEQAGMLMLEANPVLEHPVVMAEMERPGGAHAGKDTFCVHGLSVKSENGFDAPCDKHDQRVHDGAEDTGE